MPGDTWWNIWRLCIQHCKEKLISTRFENNYTFHTHTTWVITFFLLMFTCWVVSFYLFIYLFIFEPIIITFKTFDRGWKVKECLLLLFLNMAIHQILLGLDTKPWQMFPCDTRVWIWDPPILEFNDVRVKTHLDERERERYDIFVKSFFPSDFWSPFL